MAKYFTKDGDSYAEVNDTLLPQADVDGIVEKRLERERNKFADYETLKEKALKADTVKQEYEDKIKLVGTEKSELENKLKQASLETEKVKIVHEFKLSDDLHEFVVGDTIEDMRKRAEKLSNGTKGGVISIEKTPKPGEKVSDSKALAGKLFGKQSD